MLVTAAFQVPLPSQNSFGSNNCFQNLSDASAINRIHCKKFWVKFKKIAIAIVIDISLKIDWHDNFEVVVKIALCGRPFTKKVDQIYKNLSQQQKILSPLYYVEKKTCQKVKVKIKPTKYNVLHNNWKN